MDCLGLWNNTAIDEARTKGTSAPNISEEFVHEFTYHGKVRIFYRGLFNQQYLGSTAMVSLWTESMINDMRDRCANGTLQGTYGESETAFLYEALSPKPI